MFRRVIARAGLGVWRNRGGVLLAAAATLGAGGYMAVSAAGLSPLRTAAPASFAATDCADTAIAAIADKSSTAAQRAYQCMDTTFQQRVPEQAFIQQMQAQSLANVNNVNRVGDYHTPAGGTMVYYAVNANGQSVGYIVYLGPAGKVLKIE